MSRTIELSATVIKQPELLEEAVASINRIQKYGVLSVKLNRNDQHEIQGGRIFKAGAENSRRENVWLNYRGGEKATYTGNRLNTGYFTIVGDEDYDENLRLGTLVGDHYNAEVVRRHFAEQGHNVSLNYGEDGAIEVLMEENEAGLATASY